MQTLHTLIPPSNLAAVENALLQTFNTTAASTVFKIAVNDQDYVLKMDSPTAIIDDQLLSCMEIAAEAGIAPPVYYSNKKAGITITGFIKNTPLQAAFIW
ncbi:protein kinase family protein [Mucilaginibacter sp.]